MTYTPANIYEIDERGRLLRNGVPTRVIVDRSNPNVTVFRSTRTHKGLASYSGFWTTAVMMFARRHLNDPRPSVSVRIF